MVKRVKKRTVTETINEDGTKKTVVKEHAPRSVHKKVSGEKKMSAKEREDLLIENFVGLQHAMTNMSIKFGSLSDNIAKLLMVFEEAAKIHVSGGKTDNSDMLSKIDSLLNQNKTIAKGLVLMESKLRGRAESEVESDRLRIASDVSQREMRPSIGASNSNTEAPRTRTQPLPVL